MTLDSMVAGLVVVVLVLLLVFIVLLHVFDAIDKRRRGWEDPM